MARTKDMPLVMSGLVRFITPRNPAKAAMVHKAIILVLTFLSYASYHMTRKSLSVVKTVLERNCTEVPSNLPHNATTWCDWPPFDGPDSGALLSSLDSAFLFSYAIAMFISGVVADRVNLRYFLSLGMIASAIFACLAGLARTFEIHSLAYFIVIQIFFGIVQTTGWPGVMTVVSMWFDKSKRGLIFGIWNSHTSIGNILGSVIAGSFVEKDWALSFIVPGVIMAFIGILIFCFLVTHPEDVGCQTTLADNSQRAFTGYSAIPVNDPDDGGDSDSGAGASGTSSSSVTYPTPQAITARASAHSQSQTTVNESSPILNGDNEKAIGFIGALKIPGVIEFSLSLFFAKLVSYTFLFWLPKYIKESTDFSAEASAYLSTLFDVGGIIGAIVAGLVSDQSRMPASTCVSMLVTSIPFLFLYQVYGTSSLATNITLLVITGAFVNGPYALITTAVSAELGTHECLQGNDKALATVSAIIDGTGSIGAAVGPLLAGIVSPTGWYNVFYLLIASDVLALLLLTRLTYWEVSKWRRRNHHAL